MKRDPKRTAKLTDPTREAAGLGVGVEGGYFVGDDEYTPDPNDKHGVLDHNSAPDGQPGLWCGWVPNEDGTAIVWDLGEKFYNYVDWIQYLMDHFLTPWGYKLSGRVTYQGEDEEDNGFIVVYNGRTFKDEDPILEKLADV